MKSISNSWSLSKNKAIEIEFTDCGNLFELSLVVTTKCDHPGLRAVISLFGYNASFHFYDGRHWNYENDCYVNYEKETL
jgi:hypothetical protein